MTDSEFNRNKVYGISLIVVLGGFLYGYDTAVISGTFESLNRFFVEPLHLSEKLANSLLGFVVSSAPEANIRTLIDTARSYGN